MTPVRAGSGTPAGSAVRVPSGVVADGGVSDGGRPGAEAEGERQPAPAAPEWRGWWHDLRLGRALWALAALVTLWMVLGTPVKGLANNGDYQRLMQPLGVQAEPGQPAVAGTLVQHFMTGVPTSVTERLPAPLDTPAQRRYYYGRYGYASSQLLVDKAAVTVGAAVGDPRHVDIRWIGLANALVLLAGLALVLVALRPLAPGARSVAALLCVVAFTDFGYVEYFNSFFSEPSELTFLLCAVGAAAGIGALDGWRRHASVVLFVVSTVAFVWSKEGDFLSALPLMVAGVLLAWRHERRLAGRLGVVAACAVLGGATWVSAQSNIPYYQQQHYYDGTFDGILPSAPTPAVAVRELHLAPWLARYSGYPAFAGADSAFALHGIHAAFFDHISYEKMVAFYLEHPRTLLTALSVASGPSLDLRVPYLANLTTGGDAHWASDSPWTFVHQHVLPHGLWFICAVPLLSCVVGFIGYRRRRERWRLAPELAVAFGLMALVNFAESVVAEGFNELVKHQFLFNVTFDLCLIVDAVALALWLAPLFARARTAWEERAARATEAGLGLP